MKSLFAIAIALFSLSAHADVGDIYAKYGKLGRYSLEMMQFEIVGMTVAFNHDNDPATPPQNVKATVDVSGKSPEQLEMISKALNLAANNKLTLSITYNDADVSQTLDCLGKDLEITVPVTDQTPAGKACVKVKFKDLIVK